MDKPEIRFDDGAWYESFMGQWSRLAGSTFLDWLAPAPGLRWVDIGCGNGAFTELLVQRCAPAEVCGVDPSQGQIDYARSRLAGAPVRFEIGDASALPYPSQSFDAAVMALVIFFVPDPAQGVAEMARVVRPGGSVSAYAWDIIGGGFPFDAMQAAMAALGHPPLWPPSIEAARIAALRALWASAGINEIETREITVERRFDDFEAFWAIAQTGPRLAPVIGAMAPDLRERLKADLRLRVGAEVNALGPLVCTARANAIKGRMPN